MQCNALQCNARYVLHAMGMHAMQCLGARDIMPRCTQCNAHDGLAHDGHARDAMPWCTKFCGMGVWV